MLKTINLIVWSVSLALQVGLLVALYRRTLMRRFPIFTLLLGFYVLRSVALFTLSRVLERDTLNALYDFLSLADVGLQLGVAAELFFSVVRGHGEWTGKRTGIVVAWILGWLAVAAAATALLPAHGRIPVDRGLAFTAFIMILLWLWMLAARKGGLSCRIVAGFAIYGAVAVAGNQLRGYAALHRNSRDFLVGSYAPSVIYLIVLVFWLLVLKAPAPEKLPHARARASSARLSPARDRRT